MTSTPPSPTAPTRRPVKSMPGARSRASLPPTSTTSTPGWNGPRPATSSWATRVAAKAARAAREQREAQLHEESVARSAAADGFGDERAVRSPRAAVHVDAAAARAVGLLAPAAAGLCALAVHAGFAAVVPVGAALFFTVPLVIARLQGKRAIVADGIGPLGAALAGVVVAVAALDSVVLGGAGGPFAGAPVVTLAFACAAAEGAVVPGRRLAVALPLGAAGLSCALLAAGAAAGIVVADALVFLGFGMLGRALFFGTLKAVQAREEARIDGELLRLYDDARLFGLLGTAQPDDERAGEKRLIAQTLAARDGCYRLLRLGARALKPDAAAVYLLDARGRDLVLREQLVDADMSAPRARIGATAGAPGLALKRRQAIRIVDAAAALDDDAGGSGGAAVAAHRKGARAVLCAPLRDGGELRGVVVFDRASARPFSDDDESLALALCDEMVALLRTERVLERLDVEQQKIRRIFDAARAFGGTVRLEDALEHTLQAALDLAPRASVAVVEIVGAAGAPSCVVRRAAGPDRASLVVDDGAAREAAGQSAGAVPAAGGHGSAEGVHAAFAVDEEAWLGRAILQRTALPHVSLAEAGARGLYVAGDARCAGLVDVRAIPLFAQGEAVAALVVASRERLRADVVDSLLVAADLAGVAIGGARLFETVERQATTDGLTGLANRRTLDAKLDEAIARAGRLGTPVCVVLTDVDHFKSVNDVYGHGTGDDVLRAVAAALASTARTSDVVARYGGEEFCVVLEGTDAAGAARLAERMRLAVKAIVVQSEKGPLSVTSSFGVALLGASDDAGAVLSRADEKLYQAKQTGRDRVCC